MKIFDWRVSIMRSTTTTIKTLFHSTLASKFLGVPLYFCFEGDSGLSILHRSDTSCRVGWSNHDIAIHNARNYFLLLISETFRINDNNIPIKSSPGRVAPCRPFSPLSSVDTTWWSVAVGWVKLEPWWWASMLRYLSQVIWCWTF